MIAFQQLLIYYIFCFIYIRRYKIRITITICTIYKKNFNIYLHTYHICVFFANIAFTIV